MEILRSFLISVKLGSDPSCLDKEGLCPLDLVQLDSPFQIQSGGECTLKKNKQGEGKLFQ